MFGDHSAPFGTVRHRSARPVPNGAERCRMVPNGAEWCRM
eukprot:gene26897-biopygen17480